ncbi:cytochrome bd oxidase small subunit CydS [Ureibacillus composti]
MNEFMIFVAPFLTIIFAIFFAFYVAPKDRFVKENERHRK